MSFVNTYRCPRSLLVLSLSLAAVAIAPARGEVVEFEIPILGNFGSGSFDIDLGVSSIEVVSISLQMSGIAEYQEFGLGSGEAAASCDSTVLLPMDLGVSVRSDGVSPASVFWEQGASGAFRFNGPFVMAEGSDGLLAHGIGTIAYVDGVAVARFVWESWSTGAEWVECSRGSTIFDRYPIVRIEYTASVPATAESWGTSKAVYR